MKLASKITFDIACLTTILLSVRICLMLFFASNRFLCLLSLGKTVEKSHAQSYIGTNDINGRITFPVTFE